MKLNIKNILFLIIIIFFLVNVDIHYSLTPNVNYTKSNKSNKPKLNIKKKLNKTQSERKAKAKNISQKKTTKTIVNTITEIDTIISDGFRYKKIIKKYKKFINSFHILEIDLTNDSLITEVLKASNHISALADLIEIVQKRNSFDTTKEIIASVNSNFWKAYTNFPIGILISNGEVINYKNYKNWSACFFDINNQPYIDFFVLNAELHYKNIKILIDDFNKRIDSCDIIVYNGFSGDRVPYISERKIEKIINEILSDSIFSDITEEVIDTTELRRIVLQSEQEAMFEYSTYKIALRCIDSFIINKSIRLIIDSIGNNPMTIPKNGIILSFGRKDNIPDLKVGDTITFIIQTNKYSSILFKNAVTGTPRLIRDGKARPETKEEGIKSRKFIYKPLQRTAIGYNKAKTIMYIVCCENSGNGKKGVSLAQLAEFMKSIGCYQALNLDGGGSVSMVIKGQNVLKPNSNSLRRISAGLGFGKRK